MLQSRAPGVELPQVSAWHMQRSTGDLIGGTRGNSRLNPCPDLHKDSLPSDTTTNPRCDREMGTLILVVVQHFELSCLVDAAAVFR